MAVAYRTGTNANNGQTANSTAVNFTVPAGAVAEDIAIVTVVCASSATATCTAPAGWALLDTVLANTATTFVYWRKLTSVDISAAANWTLTTGVTDGIMDIFSGVDSITVIEANARSSNGTSSTTLTAPAVTSISTNAGIYNVWMGRNASGTVSITVPATHTAAQAAATAYTGAAVNATLQGGYLTAVSGAPGAHGTYAATASASSTAHNFSLALTPTTSTTAPVMMGSYISNGSSSPGAATTFKNAVAVNDLIVVAAASDGGTAGLMTAVSDSLGNTYTAVPSFDTADATNSIALHCWYAPVTVAGSNNVVSSTFNSGSSNLDVVVLHFTGFTNAPAFDQMAVQLVASATTTSSPASAATAQATELVVGLSVHASTASVYTVGSGYGSMSQIAQANRHLATEYKVTSTTGAQTATFSIVAARASITGVVAFTGMGSGGGTVTTPFTLGLMGCGS